MPTKLKSETARANGKKSRGPVTSEGKARSSRNALQHGLSAKSLVLANESPAEFDHLLDSYRAEFAPQTAVETHAVEQMALARWRLLRIATLEASLFELHLEDSERDIHEAYRRITKDLRFAWTFRHLAQSGSAVALIIRYEAALTRSYQRAFKHFQELKALRNSGGVGSFGNLHNADHPVEPAPAAGPPEALPYTENVDDRSTPLRAASVPQRTPAHRTPPRIPQECSTGFARRAARSWRPGAHQPRRAADL